MPIACANFAIAMWSAFPSEAPPIERLPGSLRSATSTSFSVLIGEAVRTTSIWYSEKSFAIGVMSRYETGVPSVSGVTIAWIAMPRSE